MSQTYTLPLLCAVVLTAAIYTTNTASIDGLNRARRDDRYTYQDIFDPNFAFGDDPECDTADLVFLLDSSGSIEIENWQLVLNFTQTIVQGFNIGPDQVQVSVISYSNRATTAFYLNSYDNMADVVQAIGKIPYKNQNTNTSGAIRTMRRDVFSAVNGDRPDAPNIGIIVTDGKPTREEEQTVPQAEAARAEGVTLFAIGIGDEITPKELNSYANQPSEQYVFNATDFNSLTYIQNSVILAACTAAADCTQNGDFTFVLDSSRGIRRNQWAAMKQFVSDMIYELNIELDLSRAGVMTFSDSAQVDIPMNAYQTRADLSDAIMALEQSRERTTETALALRMLRDEMYTEENGDRAGVNNVAIILTDGGSSNMAATIREAVQTKLAGITIIVIAVSDWYNEFELKEIASDPDDLNVFVMRSLEDFPAAVDTVRRAMCNDYDECASDPCANGGTCMNLINSYQCSCPEGYAGRYCTVECREPADVVVALDSSASVGTDVYSHFLSLTKDIVYNLNIGPGPRDSRVAVETYASDARIRYNLNTFTTRRDAVNAISFLYMDGSTNTGLALENMRDMYDESAGDREEIKNVGVLISDGHSSDREYTQEQAQRTRAHGVTLLTVGVGPKTVYDRDEMRHIASADETKNYMELDNIYSTNNITVKILDAVCNNVDECAGDVCLGGGQCVDMINYHECRCPDDRTGARCERRCSGELDLTFVVDSSGSIRRRRWSLVQSFIKDIIAQLEVNLDKVRIGVITYADEAKFRFGLDTYSNKNDIMTAIDRLPYTAGKTNTAAALELLSTDMYQIEGGDRPQVDNVAIVVTDGHSNINSEDTIPQAIRARMNGIHIAVATMENDPRNLELKGMASDPDEANIFNVARYSMMGDMVDSVVGITCDDVNECASSPCGNNGRCVDGRNTYMCVCDDGWTGVNCERRCSRQKDIVFLLDASGSVESNYDLIQRITKQIVWGLNFDSGRTRVGVITYQHEDRIRFNLNEYTRKEEVLNAIAYDQDTSEGTHTSMALQTMRERMFTARAGDRSSVDNVGIVLTDGQSNIRDQDTIPQSRMAQRDGITMMAVGVGRRVGHEEITGIASNPSVENSFFLQDESQLEDVANEILDQLCET